MVTYLHIFFHQFTVFLASNKTPIRFSDFRRLTHIRKQQMFYASLLYFRLYMD